MRLVTPAPFGDRGAEVFSTALWRTRGTPGRAFHRTRSAMSLVPLFGYRLILAPPPFIALSASDRVAQFTSPGKVCASAE